MIRYYSKKLNNKNEKEKNMLQKFSATSLFKFETGDGERERERLYYNAILASQLVQISLTINFNICWSCHPLQQSPNLNSYNLFKQLLHNIEGSLNV